jgi:hypothetical protein
VTGTYSFDRLIVEGSIGCGVVVVVVVMSRATERGWFVVVVVVKVPEVEEVSKAPCCAAGTSLRMAWMTGLVLLVSPPDLLMMAAAWAATPGATAKTALAPLRLGLGSRGAADVVLRGQGHRRHRRSQQLAGVCFRLCAALFRLKMFLWILPVPPSVRIWPAVTVEADLVPPKTAL